MSLQLSNGEVFNSESDYLLGRMNAPVIGQKDETPDEKMHIDEKTDVPLIAGALHNKDGFYGIAIDRDAAKLMTSEDKELLYHHEKAEQEATITHGMPYDGLGDKSNAAHDVVANAVEKGKAFEMALASGKHPVDFWNEHQDRMKEALPIAMKKYEDPEHELQLHPDLFKEPYQRSGMTRVAGDIPANDNEELKNLFGEGSYENALYKQAKDKGIFNPNTDSWTGKSVEELNEGFKRFPPNEELLKKIPASEIERVKAEIKKSMNEASLKMQTRPEDIAKKLEIEKNLRSGGGKILPFVREDKDVLGRGGTHKFDLED